MTDEFAQRLARLRRERGYSQEALATELGLSRQAVSKWERAESQPDTMNLIALADLYGITLDELVRDTADEGGAQGAGTVEETTCIPAREADAEEASTPVLASEEDRHAPAWLEAPVSASSLGQRQRFHNPWLTFPYPLLVVIAYLAIGFIWRWWHPGWVLFLTIPFYYWIAFVIGKDPRFRAAHTIDIEG